MTHSQQPQSEHSAHLYTYQGKVIKVYDGDTITVNVDLGFNVELKKEKFRLIGINAPEVRGVHKIAGKKSRDWLRDQILGKTIIITTEQDKKGKYGRWLAKIWLNDVCLNDELVKQNLAKYQEY